MEIRNIKPKPYKRNGVVYQGTETRNDYHAEIIPGKSIRLFGTFRNHVNGPQEFDLTFVIGDEAEYNSYNLTYTGEIVSIGAKTVTIKHYPNRETKSRLDFYDFAYRNWDFDSAKIAAENSETMMHI